MAIQTNEQSLQQIRLIYGDRPVHIYFHPNNTKAEEIRYLEDDTCAFYYENKDILLHIHAEESPAIFYEDGSTAWLRNGQYHRWGGPAIEDEQHNQVQYWLNGVPLSVEDYIDCMEADVEPVFQVTPGDLRYVRRNQTVNSDESMESLVTIATVAAGVAGLLAILGRTRKSAVKKSIKRVERAHYQNSI